MRSCCRDKKQRRKISDRLTAPVLPRGRHYKVLIESTPESYLMSRKVGREYRFPGVDPGFDLSDLAQLN